MDKLPMVESDFNELNTLYFGMVASRVMLTAIEMKLFDHLEQPLSSKDAANRFDSDPGNTELMLDALCACRLLRKENGIYRNRRLTSDFLVSGKPTYLGDWYQQADAASRPFLEGLADRVRFGPRETPEDENMNSEAYCKRYTAAHAASSLAGIARQMAVHIAALPAFSTCRSMLDLGGGPAINAMAVAEANEQLRAVVFDRPGIARMARTYIATYGFEDRVTAVGGNYLTDPLGEGYDLILITDTLYYTDSEIDPVLKKCQGALNPGGILVGIHAVLTDDRTGPASLVLDLLTETMTGQAQLPEKGFLVRALGRCGFDGILSEMVTICGSLMEMNVARKK
jgi:predicted O-methyltransferase YrrM